MPRCRFGALVSWKLASRRARARVPRRDRARARVSPPPSKSPIAGLALRSPNPAAAYAESAPALRSRDLDCGLVTLVHGDRNVVIGIVRPVLALEQKQPGRPRGGRGSGSGRQESSAVRRAGACFCRPSRSPLSSTDNCCWSSYALCRISPSRVSTRPAPTASRVGKGVRRAACGGIVTRLQLRGTGSLRLSRRSPPLGIAGVHLRHLLSAIGQSAATTPVSRRLLKSR